MYSTMNNKIRELCICSCGCKVLNLETHIKSQRHMILQRIKDKKINNLVDEYGDIVLGYFNIETRTLKKQKPAIKKKKHGFNYTPSFIIEFNE